MKNDILIDAIGLINEETVRDAWSFQKKNARFSVKRVLAAAAAVVLCFTLSIPALAAADVESAYELLYKISPPAAQSLKPVKKSCLDNGIQMDVVSADIHNNRAEIYITMKDLEGSRIDETLDLFDSYDIRGLYDSIGTCSLESYDKKTGVATFYILIEQMNKVKIQGSKITFSVSRFLSGKNTFEGVLSEIDLSSVSKAPKTQSSVNIRGGSMSDLPEDTKFLKAGNSPLFAPADGASITAAGYIDGKLHIQAYYEDILKTDNHGWLQLKGRDGSYIDCEFNEAFWDDKESGSYEEYVFDIPYDKLPDYQLYGEFITCSQLTEGDWQVTFPLKDVQ